MFQKYPADKNSPLFLQCRQGSFIALTDSVARKHLKQVSLLLQIQPPWLFIYFVSLQLRGLFTMVYQCTKLCSMVPGPVKQCGDTYTPYLHLSLTFHVPLETCFICSLADILLLFPSRFTGYSNNWVIYFYIKPSIFLFTLNSVLVHYEL